jgi:hypothetical protein
MEERYKIEHGVAMPKSHGRCLKYPLDEMEVGDSFAIPGSDVSKVRNAAKMFGVRNNRKYSVRCVDPIKGEYRCWRIA